MKLKAFLPLLIICSVALSSNKITAQSLLPNTVVLQPYIGAPNMKKWLYDQDYDADKSSKGFGHVGLSGEVAVSKRIGLGFDAIYSPLTRTRKLTTSVYDQNSGMFNDVTQIRKFEENKLRIIAKMYIHFNIENPQWDLYISGGMGANILFRRAFIDGEQVNYDQNNVYYDNDIFLVNPFPFSGRFCFGARYFFSDYIGINFETGVGGPPFSFGMNVRF